MDADTIIVGAGLSGICASALWRRQRPQDGVIVLEARDAIGGTWDFFRYPGIRSDSDMHTLGYSFRPWLGEKAITDGASIRDYIRATAREEGVEDLIRYRHALTDADWHEDDQLWHLTVDTPEGARHLTCRFLVGCTGYYDYGEGYCPTFEGEGDFPGPILHPQAWPADLDWSGKRVAVIGSGATAVTLVPELARAAAHVTMIQRTPTFVAEMPASDAVATRLQKVLPQMAAHGVTRWKNILMGMGFFQASQRMPKLVGGWLSGNAARRSGQEAEHFHAPYRPWDQRLCLAPDGDIFDTLAAGDASVRTGAIARFTPRGVEMAEGDTIEADIIVVATGLKLKIGGGAAIRLDGEAQELAELTSYKGAMLSNVPNLVQMFGYTNASWTLKCELIARWAIRLADAMDARGATSARPVPPPDLKREPAVPLTAGYIERARGQLPLQGDRRPWRIHQNYLKDRYEFGRAPIDDGTMVFKTPPRNSASAGPDADRAA
ncbi:NAD(P)/FAD-dependent oxidoreductase [Roseobacter sp. HKCCA0434]|uniref:flavin-containing monooxygenase n=1 Tax=Roseobacter sp. HKCCA0434 TaxID=3079297 RepID=UPI0029057E41|nr:NAD(P)/FAD-dependent oxidoreductase [Roseobacter sp. HKCCA0434]